MKYKNIKTGAVVDSSFKISGNHWELVDDLQTGKPEQNSENDYIEEEVNLEEMTNKELEGFAEEHDVQLSSDDKKNKETRINAIAKAFE